jgi:hypothetical protein
MGRNIGGDMQSHPVACGRNDVTRFRPAVSSATRRELTNRGKYVTRMKRGTKALACLFPSSDNIGNKGVNKVAKLQSVPQCALFS